MTMLGLSVGFAVLLAPKLRQPPGFAIVVWLAFSQVLTLSRRSYTSI